MIPISKKYSTTKERAVMDYKKLYEEQTEEYERYRFNHYLDPQCEFCNIPLTEDDLGMSVSVGHFCCEACCEEKELGEEPDPHTEKLSKEIDRLQVQIRGLFVQINTQKKENKELKEITEGIMNEEGTGHILGCNAYEKFCQAMCELNHDEEWITQLKEENKELKKQLEIANKEKKQKTKILKKFKADLIEEKQQKIETCEDSLVIMKAHEKLKEEVEELKAFKTKVEEECEASAVMNDMMARVEKAEGETNELKEALATKFYDHYNSEGYNRAFLANIGPDLSDMIDSALEETITLGKWADMCNHLDADLLQDAMDDAGYQYNDEGLPEKQTDQ